MGKVRKNTHRKTKSGNALKTEDIAKVAKMLPLESKEKRRDYEAFTNHATNDYLSVSARWQAYEVSLGVLAGKLCKAGKSCAYN